MPQLPTLINNCMRCSGTGLFRGVPCWRCNGDGNIESQALKLEPGFVWSSSVMDCIDNDEYLALGPNYKNGVNVVLSLGVINLNESSKEREWLFGAFGEGTTTKTALDALIATILGA